MQEGRSFFAGLWIIQVNDEEFIIDMGVYEQPIRLLYQIENLSSNSYKTYYIHPHLIKLLTDYKANNRWWISDTAALR